MRTNGALALAATLLSLLGTAFAAGSVTFHKNVEPILQQNCQSCHRPGQAGPKGARETESAHLTASCSDAFIGH